jgi:hypothetical protein
LTDRINYSAGTAKIVGGKIIAAKSVAQKYGTSAWKNRLVAPTTEPTPTVLQLSVQRCSPSIKTR